MNIGVENSYQILNYFYNKITHLNIVTEAELQKIEQIHLKITKSYQRIVEDVSYNQSQLDIHASSLQGAPLKFAVRCLAECYSSWCILNDHRITDDDLHKIENYSNGLLNIILSQIQNKNSLSGCIYELKKYPSTFNLILFNLKKFTPQLLMTEFDKFEIEDEGLRIHLACDLVHEHPNDFFENTVTKTKS